VRLLSCKLAIPELHRVQSMPAAPSLPVLTLALCCTHTFWYWHRCKWKACTFCFEQLILLATFRS
jgi:hypothetical protein